MLYALVCRRGEYLLTKDGELTPYSVMKRVDGWRCTCAGDKYKPPCKHVRALNAVGLIWSDDEP